MTQKLPKTVVSLGVVSLLTDVSSEAIFPLLPVFLTTLGASNAFIGLIEGSADLASNILKYVVGRLADTKARLKPIVLLGYGISTCIRPLVAFAAAPWHVLLVRLGDRLGKGIRTSPRDAMIAHATDSSLWPLAYGFHRAMDHAGAALGTLFSLSILWLLGVRTMDSASADQLRTVFLWAALPGVFAMLALTRAPEPKTLPRESEASAKIAALSPAFRKALIPVVMFSFANATDAFIIVQATSLGASPLLAPVLWLTLHLVKSATATQGGKMASRLGKRNTIAVGWTIYAATWAAIGFSQSLSTLFILTAIYGTSHGLVEGCERALIAEMADRDSKGRAFGWYNMLTGLSALAAGVTFGALWDAVGSRVAFVGFGGIALVAAITLLLVVPNPPVQGQPTG